MLGLIFIVFFFILFGCDHQTVQNPEINFAPKLQENFSRYHLQFLSGEFYSLNSYSQPYDYLTTRTLNISGTYYAYSSQMVFDGREGLYKDFSLEAYEESNKLLFTGRWGLIDRVFGEAIISNNNSILMEFTDSKGDKYRGSLRSAVPIATTKEITGTWDIILDNGDVPNYRWVLDQNGEEIVAYFASSIGQQTRGSMVDEQLNLAFVDRDGESLAFTSIVQQDNSFSGTWYYTKNSTVGTFRAARISKSRIVPVCTLMDESILIDSFFYDWDDVPTFFIDTNSATDIANVTGADLEFVKLAVNASTGALFFFMKVADNISDDIRYRLYIDGNKDNALDSEFDFLISAEFTSSGWDIISSNFSGSGYNLIDNGQVSVLGMYLEGSVNMVSLGIPSTFWVYFSTSSAEPPYPQYDTGFAFQDVYIPE